MQGLDNIEWLEALPDAVIVSDQGGTVVYANKVCQSLLGWSPEELIGDTIEKLVPTRFADHAAMREHFVADASRRSMGSGVKLSALHKSGDEVGVDIALSPVHINGTTYILSAIRDMPTQRQEASMLHVLTVAINAAASGIVITDTRGRIKWVNPAACRITGYESNELVGHSTKMLKSGHHDTTFYADLWKTVSSGKVWRGDMINKRKDGSLYYEEQTIAPVTDPAGSITHYIAIKQDVSARVYAEEMMRTGISAIQHAANGVAVTDINDRLTLVNPAMLALWGYDHDQEMIGRSMVDLWDDGKQWEAMAAIIHKGNDEWHGELTAKRKDGSTLPIQVVASRNLDLEGRLIGIIFSFVDASVRKRTEETMKQAEGQRAMVASLATVCHHMGQPSTVVTVNTSVLDDLLQDAPDKVRKVLAETQEACDEIQAILHQLQRANFYNLASYLDTAIDTTAPYNQILDLLPKSEE